MRNSLKQFRNGYTFTVHKCIKHLNVCMIVSNREFNCFQKVVYLPFRLMSLLSKRVTYGTRHMIVHTQILQPSLWTRNEIVDIYFNFQCLICFYLFTQTNSPSTDIFTVLFSQIDKVFHLHLNENIHQIINNLYWIDTCTKRRTNIFFVEGVFKTSRFTSKIDLNVDYSVRPKHYLLRIEFC